MGKKEFVVASSQTWLNLVFIFVFQIESLKHSHKLEVTSIKLECTRSKGELERDRDTLQGQIEGRDAKNITKTTLHAHHLKCANHANMQIHHMYESISTMCIAVLQTDVEMLKAAVERHKEALVEKERDTVRKVQSAREEEFRKTAALHEEK